MDDGRQDEVQWKQAQDTGGITMIQINLDEKVVQALGEKARAMGLTLESYLATLAGETNGEGLPRLSADELVGIIESEATSGNSRYTGTYSRADIYLDHN
jgi:hypothetical protein